MKKLLLLLALSACSLFAQSGGNCHTTINGVSVWSPCINAGAVYDSGGQVFNVKSFGAKGDNVTDDTAAIQATYTAASAVAGTVFFPCATYKTTAALTVSAPVTFEGVNQGCAVIQLVTGTTADVIDVTSSNVVFRTLTINANASNAASYGVLMTGAPLTNITFDRVTVENAGNWCASWGNGASSAVSNLLVTGSTFTGCGGPQFGGITSSGSISASNMVFVGNTFGSTNVAPPLLTSEAHVSLYIGENTPGSFSNIQISNNVILFPIFASQESDGIVLSTGGLTGATISNVTITGNLVQGTPAVSSTNSHGIEMWGVSSTTVSGNQLGNAYNVLLLQQGATGTACDAAITGNSVLGSLASSGFLLSNNCAAEVSGNRVSTLLDAVFVGGSHQTVTGNSFAATSSEVVHLKCSETGGCSNDTVSNNEILGTGNANGIILDAGTANFAGLAVLSNQLTGAASAYNFYSNATTATGVVSGNTISGTTHTYGNFPSTLVLVNGVGTAIASAATIAPNALITHITGTTTITTITAPSVIAASQLGGCYTFIPDGLWVTGTTGNIAIASTAVVSKALTECYDNATAKWYPSY